MPLVYTSSCKSALSTDANVTGATSSRLAARRAGSGSCGSQPQFSPLQNTHNNRTLLNVCARFKQHTPSASLAVHGRSQTQTRRQYSWAQTQREYKRDVERYARLLEKEDQEMKQVLKKRMWRWVQSSEIMKNQFVSAASPPPTQC